MLALLVSTAASAMTLLVSTDHVDRTALRQAVELRCPDAGPSVTLTVTDSSAGGLSLVLLDRGSDWSDAWTMSLDAMTGTDLDRATAVAACNRHDKRIAVAEASTHDDIGEASNSEGSASDSQASPALPGPEPRLRRPRRENRVDALIDDKRLRLYGGAGIAISSVFYSAEGGTLVLNAAVPSLYGGARLAAAPIVDWEFRGAFRVPNTGGVEVQGSVHAAIGSPFRARLHRGPRIRVGVDVDTFGVPVWYLPQTPEQSRYLVPSLALGAEYSLAAKRLYGRATCDVLLEGTDGYSPYGLRWDLMAGININRWVAAEVVFENSFRELVRSEIDFWTSSQTTLRGGVGLTVWLDPMPVLERFQNPSAPKYPEPTADGSAPSPTGD